jgi:hypothetical protein
MLGHPFHFGLLGDFYQLEFTGSGFSQLFKKMLGLSPFTPFETPVPGVANQAAACQALERAGYSPGKTVIFAAEAHSTPSLPMAFWQTLREALAGAGFTVLLNRDLGCSFGEMIPAVELAGAFVGVRSGLCDIVSTAAAKKIVLFPDAPFFNWNVYGGASLRRMGLAENITEIVYREEEAGEIVNRIVEAVAG